MASIVEMDERRAARFERAVLPYLDHIYAAALLMTRDLEDADDLVQRTFEQAYASFHQVQPGTDVKAWLYQAFSSTFTDSAGWRLPDYQPLAADQRRHPPLADAEPPIPAGMGRTGSEAVRQLPDPEIKRAVQELPAELRLAVYLSDVEGYTYREIADIVEAPIPTVASRLHRGRRRLRELLLRAANTATLSRLARR